MKDSTLLVVVVLAVVCVFVMPFTIHYGFNTGAEAKPAHKITEEVKKEFIRGLLENIIYVQDPKTEICYAICLFEGENGIDDVSITLVPYEHVKYHLTGPGPDEKRHP